MTAAPLLGLRANWRQFALLVLVNAFVGGMVGMERNTVPLLADRTFHVQGAALGAFVAAFAFTKAMGNFASARAAERYGRKRVLVAGWMVGIAVPLLIIAAPNWWWVVGANVLLGINQALTWSMTVNMKIDLVGPARRGLALGINEAAGYGAVGGVALVAGLLAAAFGPRPWPFLLGLGLAIAGLLVSWLLVRDTSAHVRLEQLGHHTLEGPPPSAWQVFAITSWRERALSAASQAGLVNNLNDGMIWALLPGYLLSRGASLNQMVVVTAIYPLAWGGLQVATGSLSDRWGRKRLIAGGMLVQAAALAALVLSSSLAGWLAAATLLGLGTAMVYPCLLAVVGDVAQPRWRATAVGVYRFWRDSGYGVGALLGGAVALSSGYATAIALVAGLTALSGLVVALRMYETLPSRSRVRGLPV